MSEILQQIDNILQESSCYFNINSNEAKNLPKDEAFVAVSRHHHADLDYLLMLRILLEANDNARIIVYEDHPHTQIFPDHFIRIDVNSDTALKDMFRAKGAINETIRNGGPIGIFPAPQGRFKAKKGTLEMDKRWHITIIRLIEKLKLPVIPLSFQIAQEDDSSIITARVGSRITVQEQAAFKRPSRLGKFLRARTVALGTPIDVKQFYFPNVPKLDARHQIAPPVAHDMIVQEMARLKESGNLLFSKAEYEIYISRAKQVPNTLLEIGRLREITFREIGEGSNKPRDIDEYDLYYDQLIIYDKDAQVLVGGYRIGRGDDIMSSYGVKGFYTASLFKYKKKFRPYLQEAAELGRAYIIPEYQKKRLPLFLLWRGILSFLMANPQYKYLIGPLSISQYYSDISKQLIIEFVKRHYYDHKLAAWVKPRKPYEVQIEDIDVDVLLENMQGDVKKLDNFIEEIEPYHFKVPVLMKKYIDQNARIIAFNVDPTFSDTLDGLMILNFEELPQETIDALQKEMA